MTKLKVILITAVLLIMSSCGEKKDTAGSNKEDAPKEEKKQPEEMQTLKEEAQKNDDAGQTNEADLNKLNELGMTPGLPSNFPSDVPQPKNAKTLGSLNSSEGTVVTFESNDNVNEVISYYKEEMKKNGFEISEAGESIIPDKGGLINWKKNNREVNIMLGYDKDKSITSLVITYK